MGKVEPGAENMQIIFVRGLNRDAGRDLENAGLCVLVTDAPNEKCAVERRQDAVPKVIDRHVAP